MPQTATASQVVIAVAGLLNAAQAVHPPALSLDYIVRIYQGDKQREDIPSLPAIIIYPISETETAHSVPQFNRILLTLGILVWLETQGDGTDTLTGDTKTPAGATKGIMQMIEDIKNVVNNNWQLGGIIIRQRFTRTTYEFTDFPNQYAEVQMEVEYITQYNTR